ncbi:Peptidoglycan/LPS O-acetylase OafA/YrhL, contains acyltransferase and SGNH-hydrolase domains [Ekhidna lutea]|uniref:Peptidoglycan/LPS O-acetylase OafA/YrhL, contains acyltransferase and SGNH-hydrolase domains n=1 Tax=Ekhidna lutea TaxID=447679 RepID=A0A239FI07_EKHLU|nr:acyltransferase [Ekhidna lutea]SNS56425.1 Peptidoglycan/LPS O-acetylase OafA/YrhL, contains acyltransferase and SGNH-hydrolase domains [Ekhidna lutea]
MNIKSFLKNNFQRQTSSGKKFIEEIDGLRFFAIAPVVVHHLAERVIRQMRLKEESNHFDEFIFELIPSGPLGVELFFIISGFVISLPLLKSWLNGNSVKQAFSYWKYFKRRLTRLEPPYVLVMVVGLLAIIFITNSGSDSFTSGTRSFSKSSISIYESFIASILYLHGLVFLSYPRINPPAWSLEIEFQFYVVAPFILFFIFYLVKIFNGRLSFYFILGLILILLKAIVYFLVPEVYHKFLVTNYIEFFFLGFVLCYLYLQGIFNRKSYLVSSLQFICGLLVFLITDFYLKESDSLLLEFLKIGGMLIFFTGVLSGGIGKKIASNTWIVTIGGMCYSIYLIHLLLLQVGVSQFFNLGYNQESFIANLGITGLIGLPIILITSAIFFKIIEQPCMNPHWISDLKSFLKKNFLNKQS